uniref:Uncharacterized protein n=1 Tax=Timema shepardi TaxID=629360 RepID=A0A7R9FYI4_TIMSH|nr:unnamed protein product [Timema shepardi]
MLAKSGWELDYCGMDFLRGADLVRVSVLFIQATGVDVLVRACVSHPTERGLGEPCSVLRTSGGGGEDAGCHGNETSRHTSTFLLSGIVTALASTGCNDTSVTPHTRSRVADVTRVRCDPTALMVSSRILYFFQAAQRIYTMRTPRDGVKRRGKDPFYSGTLTRVGQHRSRRFQLIVVRCPARSSCLRSRPASSLDVVVFSGASDSTEELVNLGMNSNVLEHTAPRNSTSQREVFPGESFYAEPRLRFVSEEAKWRGLGCGGVEEDVTSLDSTNVTSNPRPFEGRRQKLAKLANALVVLSSTAEDGDIKVRISVGGTKKHAARLGLPERRVVTCSSVERHKAVALRSMQRCGEARVALEACGAGIDLHRCLDASNSVDPVFTPILDG